MRLVHFRANRQRKLRRQKFAFHCGGLCMCGKSTEKSCKMVFCVVHRRHLVTFDSKTSTWALVCVFVTVC